MRIAAAAAETRSLLLLCCHAARVRLVMQAHDAVVLVRGSMFLLRRARQRRCAAVGGGRAHCRSGSSNSSGMLTWLRFSTSLVRARGSGGSGSSSNTGCTIDRVRLLLALRCVITSRRAMPSARNVTHARAHSFSPLLRSLPRHFASAFLQTIEGVARNRGVSKCDSRSYKSPITMQRATMSQRQAKAPWRCLLRP